jgi:hypothetical protein
MDYGHFGDGGVAVFSNTMVIMGKGGTGTRAWPSF